MKVLKIKVRMYKMFLKYLQVFFNSTLLRYIDCVPIM